MGFRQKAHFSIKGLTKTNICAARFRSIKKFEMRKRAHVMKDVSHPDFITWRFVMASYALKLKRKLNSIIRNMALQPAKFSKRPGKDFTRSGKLGLEKTLAILLSMEGKSLNNELMRFFPNSPDLPSASAFVQSRSKLNDDALPFLFKSFVSSQPPKLFYRGYRLLAVDGSTLQIPYTPSDKESLVIYSDRQRPVNMLHLHALYDLKAHTYVDAVIEGKQVYNEHRALIQMCSRNPIPHSLYIADRGYESFNLVAHFQMLKTKFLIRIRDSCGILSGLPLPISDEFDCSFSLKVSGKKTKHTRLLFQDKTHFKYISSQHLDYTALPVDDDGFFPLHFRVVRFRLSDDHFEAIITNLDPDSFPVDELKKLYAMRWGIETSFRKLKYTLGLLCFHAKKVEYIRQEIFARLIMYNFCELITSHITIRQSSRKLDYQVNFSAAVHVCRQFFRGNVSPPILEALISRYISPIRPDRSFPRTPPARGVVSFAYRIA